MNKGSETGEREGSFGGDGSVIQGRELPHLDVLILAG